MFRNLKLDHSIQRGEFHNDLEKPAFELNPELLQIKKNLLSAGFAQVMMTGSGSALICKGEAKLPSLPALTSVYPVNYLNRETHSWYKPSINHTHQANLKNEI